MHHESLGSVVRVLALVLFILLLVVKMSLPRTHISRGDDIQQPPARLAPPTRQAVETAPDSDEPGPTDEPGAAASWECCSVAAE
jgi:hypothetical protein